MCSADLSLEDWWNNSLAGLSKENRRSKVRGVASMGQGALAPLPHVVHWSLHKLSKKFWHNEKEEEREERKK